MDLTNRRGFLGAWVLGSGVVSPWPQSAGSATPAVPRGSFSVRDFGAAADGRTLDTRAIQSAIDAAGAIGGEVYFPAGTYLSGTVFLKSHVALRLEAGAILLGSRNRADYPAVKPRLRSYTDTYVNQSLIYGEDLENVALVGHGTLNGQGAAFEGDYPGRPYIVRMINCRNVRVSDLTMVDSAMWVQHYLACEDVAIRGLTVRSRVNANNDGIDIDACQRVRISDCDIWSGDDSIVIKSTIDRPCRDVTVTNCTVSSLCNGFKLGTESVGGFDNIVISNSTVYDTNISAVALEEVDGGALENVQISGIAMRNVKSALFLRLGNRARPIYEGAPKPGVGSFRNVIIRDIQASGLNKVGTAIAGLAGRALENVTLSNIHLRVEGAGTRADAARDIPEQEAAYPEYGMFGVLQSYGIYARHVKGLQLRDIRVSTEQDDQRPALVCDDVEDLTVSYLQAPAGSPVIVLRNARNGWLDGNRAARGADTYLRIEGEHSEAIRVAANDFGQSTKAVDVGSDVRTGALVTK